MTTTPRSPDIGSWYERYAPALRGVAARVTGDPDDADDALHDAFLAAWRSRGRFDPAASPFPWLATIARRKALTIVAGRVRPSLRLPAGVSPSAEEEALGRAADGWVANAVRHEPALALHALHGLPARVIGERLGVPLRTAASRIARGRRRVERMLTATSPSPTRSSVS
jgi:DNA-directed RNA polymerase specialized sigma24 family protein